MILSQHGPPLPSDECFSLILQPNCSQLFVLDTLYEYYTK